MACVTVPGFPVHFSVLDLVLRSHYTWGFLYSPCSLYSPTPTSSSIHSFCKQAKSTQSPIVIQWEMKPWGVRWDQLPCCPSLPCLIGSKVKSFLVIHMWHISAEAAPFVGITFRLPFLESWDVQRRLSNMLNTLKGGECLGCPRLSVSCHFLAFLPVWCWPDHATHSVEYLMQVSSAGEVVWNKSVFGFHTRFLRQKGKQKLFLAQKVLCCLCSVPGENW